MKSLFVFLLLPFLLSPAFAQSPQQLPTDKGTLLVNVSTDPPEPSAGSPTKLKINFINPTTKETQVHVDYKVTVTKDENPVFDPIPLTHTSEGTATIPVEFRENGEYKITINIEGILFQPIPQETVIFTSVIGEAAAQPVEQPQDSEGGGCLIATATYGTELSPQVQLLRELRDNVVFGTASGKAFMSGFNQFYYSFSPTVADWERQNPSFKEMVKITITPMLYTLSALNTADVDSEQKMLGYGIGIILLNVGVYFVAPAAAIIILYRAMKRKHKIFDQYEVRKR
ncbi:MAG: CFI-box-CTERM domain-containing protein [Candidatus Nitrosotenuis sp.]